ITKHAAYAMVDENSSEIDRVFSLAQAQTMRKYMASKEEEWEQVDPSEAIRLEFVLENDNIKATCYCYDENLRLLATRLFDKEKSSIMASLKLQKLMNIEEDN
ncbi:MAG: hypothetical protein PHR89_04175, partial [Bacilli bacterium]|nr:hypothetical protein [Bacilli bacterium]